MQSKPAYRVVKAVLFLLLAVFVLLNIGAAVHAYKFSHFSKKGVRNEQLKLDAATKVRLLLTGVDNPRPVNEKTPDVPFEDVSINSNVRLSCWRIPAKGTARGDVVLFHGYTSDKSRLIERAMPLVDVGYNCLLVDFMGSGGSGGNATTIGYHEAQEVRDCYAYLRNRGSKRIFLLGSSMGAVAIMKAIADYGIEPAAVVLECPFATMYETVAIRCRTLHAPEFPLAALLVFYGGLENGFWGFSHNPVDYARKIKCPVLLQYGQHDDRVAPVETARIRAAIPGPVTFRAYPNAGHDDYLATMPAEWRTNVTAFLSQF